ncbi:MAG: DoxX family protein [Betaproteobacteria bacterium]
MDIVKKYGPLAGRVLLALIFIVDGFGKIAGFEGTIRYMQAYHMPMTQILAVMAIIIELGGGIMIAVGWRARWAAAAFFIYVLVVSFIFHAFWAVPENQVQLQKIMFMKNLAIMGGMLYLMVYGSGPRSVDKNR